jgi:Collagen triple helix repeat (20 copies)
LPREVYDDLPEAILDVVADIIADERKEWIKERERQEAESRAIESGLKATIAELQKQALEWSRGLEADIRRTNDAVIAEMRDLLANVKDGIDGKDGAPGEKGEQGEVGPAGPPGEKGEPGENGRDGSQGPKGEKGEPGQIGERGEKGDPGEAGLPGRDGIDGKDADEEAVIHRVLQLIPAPEKGDPGQNGKDAEVDYPYIIDFAKREIRDLMALNPPEKGEKGDPGPEGPPGRDGKDAADIAGAFRTHDGTCVLTLNDGRVLNLDIRDGAPGKDGKDGRDGKDGLSFDAFKLMPEYDGERTFRLKWLDSAGQLHRSDECRMPVMMYREVYKSDTQYHAGDTVTYGGSLWVALKDTQEKPDNANGDWRLACKHGRDGRDGVKGEKGDPGQPGRPGRDLTLA